MANILIIDDDPDFRYALERIVRRMEHLPTSCATFAEGKVSLQQEYFDAVFLDVMLPDGNGLDLLPVLKGVESQPESIIITGMGDSQGAELALTNGAWDYISKSTSPKDISLTLSRALMYREQKIEAAGKTAAVALHRDNIIGSSPAISHCFNQLAQCARSDLSVMITGETGTGKELFAQAIHQNSHRADGPFVLVDCAALTETLVESTLFGHKKGAFTGADADNTGLVIKANGGTLYLDEVGEIPLATQKTFLRVLQERTVRPVGATAERQCDFRLVAATNRNLEKMVEEGSFRSDLFFRLQSFSINLPPLKARGSDVTDIATFHINKFCDASGIERKSISDSFYENLANHNWPGNVRELVNCVQQAIISAGLEPVLYPKHLPLSLRIKAKQAALGKQDLGAPAPASISTLISIPPAEEDLTAQTLHEFREAASAHAERTYLQSVLKATKGDVKEVIRISGLSQSRLYALLKKYNLRTSGKK